MVKQGPWVSVIKILMMSMCLGMIGLIILTSLKSNMFQLSPVVLNEPWFQTTLVDFYFNIAILSIWVIYREHHWVKCFFWILGFICLGSVATSYYVFLQLLRLKPGQGIEAILTRKL